MKAAFSRAALLKTVERVVSVVPSSKTIPILQYLHVQAEPDRVIITASNLAVSLSAEVTGTFKVAEPGAALYPAQELLSTLRASGGPSYALSATSDASTGIGGPTRWVWKTTTVTNFPPAPSVEGVLVHEVKRLPFLKALRLVRSAVPSEGFSANLRQVAVRGGKVQASDGIRYHEVAVPEIDGMEFTFSHDLIGVVISMLADTEAETVLLTLPEANGLFLNLQVGPVLLTARVYLNTFPDVSSALLVPSMANNIDLVVDRTDLITAVRRVRVLADPETKSVRFRLSDKDFSVMEVLAKRSTGSWALEEIAVEWSSGLRQMMFNHEHLMHLLSLFEAEKLTLRLGLDLKHKPSSVLIQDGDRAGVLQQLRWDW